MAIPVSHIENMPLFMGMAQSELNEIAENTHFIMHHYKKGAMIIEEGMACNTLVFLSKGWALCDTYSDDRSYHLQERLQSPQMLEPDKLFGLHCYYQSMYKAETSCDIIAVTKDDLLAIFAKYIIVRLNYLNMLCRKSQHNEHLPWQVHGTDAEQYICNFIKHHCRYPAGHKFLFIKMTQMAHELNLNRVEVSKALNSMAEAERIIQRRGMIEVPALQLLQI